jgi:hypothetical protein
MAGTLAPAHVGTMATLGRNAAILGIEIAIVEAPFGIGDFDSVVTVICITGLRSGACRALLACGLNRHSL